MTGPVYSKAALLDFLTATIAATMQFNGAKIMLVENTVPITPATPFADLVPASYGGYANSAAVVWQTEHVDMEGKAVVQCLPKEFKPTDSTATSTVHQVVLVNGAANAILASYPLDDPIVFGTPSDVHLIGFPLIVMQPTADLENIVP